MRISSLPLEPVEVPNESVQRKLAHLPNWGEASKMVNHVAIETPEDALRATRQSVPSLFEPRSCSSLPPNWHIRPIQFRRYDMADPKKQEKDFTKEVDSIIPETQALAKVRSSIAVVCDHC